MTLNVFVQGLSHVTASGGPPAAELLPPRLRRRTSLLTRLAAQALSELAAETSVDLATEPMVFGSAFGEIDTTIRLLAMMHEHDGALSPTRFHNSVHNTAAGYVSIATGNRGFSTAIAAGPETVASTLLECQGLLATRFARLAMVIAEEPVPTPFAVAPRYEAHATAMLLAAEPSRAGQPRLTGLRPGGGVTHDVAPSLGPCGGSIVLAEACRAARTARVALDVGGRGWSIDVQPGGP